MVAGGDRLTAEVVVTRLLEPGRRLGFDRLVLSGGEPLLSPHLMEVLSAAAQCGYRTTLATNMLAMDGKTARCILDRIGGAGGTIQFSFDSIVKEEMERIRGGNVYALVMEHVRELVRVKRETDSPVRLCSALVLQPDNVSSALSTVDFLLGEIGVDKLLIQPRLNYPAIDLDNFRLQTAPGYSPQLRLHLLAIVRKLFDRAAAGEPICVPGGKWQNWSRLYLDPQTITGQCTARAIVTISRRGDYHPCVFGAPSGNLFSLGLEDYLRSSLFDRARKLSDKCTICILNGSGPSGPIHREREKH